MTNDITQGAKQVHQPRGSAAAETSDAEATARVSSITPEVRGQFASSTNLLSPQWVCPNEFAELFSSEGIRRIAQGNLTAAQCADLLNQYKWYVDAFPRLMALAISRLDTDVARFPLVSNLYEEHGEQDISKNHRDLYSDLLANIAHRYPPLREIFRQPPRAPVKSFVRSCELALSRANDAFALGFIGTGTEGVTCELYSVIQRLMHPFPAVRDTFFGPHSEVDTHHTERLLPAIESIVAGRRALASYRAGVRSALRLEHQFWERAVRAVATQQASAALVILTRRFPKRKYGTYG